MIFWFVEDQPKIMICLLLFDIKSISLMWMKRYLQCSPKYCHVRAFNLTFMPFDMKLKAKVNIRYLF